jgi:splicing factor 3A subunit 2
LPAIAEEEGEEQPSSNESNDGDVKMGGGIVFHLHHNHHRHDESSLSSLDTDATSTYHGSNNNNGEAAADNTPIQFLVATPHGRTAAVNFLRSELQTKTYEEFCGELLQAARARDLGTELRVLEDASLSSSSSPSSSNQKENSHHHKSKLYKKSNMKQDRNSSLAASLKRQEGASPQYFKKQPPPPSMMIEKASVAAARKKQQQQILDHQLFQQGQSQIMMMEDEDEENSYSFSPSFHHHHHHHNIKNLVVEEDDDANHHGISNNNNGYNYNVGCGYDNDDEEDNNTETSLMNTTKRALVVVDDCCEPSPPRPTKRRRVHEILLVHEGKIIEKESFGMLAKMKSPCYLGLKLAIVGGIDRQNRVGSKFGGGGVSSSQQAERERKERLKQLALESIDLAKDPYLMRNHLGTYECKLCLTLHTNEANYLAHTQGKKHQQGLARRAHMEKLKQEREGGVQPAASTAAAPAKRARVKIGRPAYQVFKSRDPDTKQRCLSFELSYPEIDSDLQPRHRFMSAFEQRVESPPDRRYQYLLFAADPYETVAFKIPNEPIDKGEGRFVTHWDGDEKKFILTLYFNEDSEAASAGVVATTT